MYFRYRKIIFLLLAYLINNNLALADNKNIEFDIDSLKSLGYGSEIADYFKEGSHFLPGYHDVTIIVNSSLNYSDNILINEKGNLCLNNQLIDKLKLKKKR
ncbi:TPA: hypothetical protein ACPUE9_002296 [Proteus mirabilis]|uniref:hypothetical protein n=1 Tax=Proteus mirabilis TaxID=584 RepID=UPI001F36CD38|nr:hypothetical protein [Proteus mirabilis]MCY9777327.1 hypothetical protein [Proteus mirabilis]MCY9781054.1 hypothetical protein [Proteus mirabilis]MCY9788992.1 hypothetical protein [Proteus mirabilis]MDM3592951.1 hypothetical protein [Proteus mirabilis]